MYVAHLDHLVASLLHLVLAANELCFAVFKLTRLKPSILTPVVLANMQTRITKDDLEAVCALLIVLFPDTVPDSDELALVVRLHVSSKFAPKGLVLLHVVKHGGVGHIYNKWGMTDTIVGIKHAIITSESAGPKVEIENYILINDHPMPLFAMRQDPMIRYQNRLPYWRNKDLEVQNLLCVFHMVLLEADIRPSFL